MLVSDIKTQIGDLIGVDESDTDVAARLLRFINNARRVLYRVRDWDALKSYYQLNRIIDYSTGTVSITQDTRTVTGSGTSFSSAMVGRYINFQYGNGNQSQWYRVIAVNSTTELLIDADYIGSTVSGVTYVIRKIFYRIPAAARKIKNISQFASPRLIDEIGDRAFLKNWALYHTSTGSPDKYQLAGVYGKEDSYSTGTVTGSQYSTTLTGLGTLWLSNALPGDKITIASQDYYIKSVDSDTQVTLYAGLTAAASGASYEIKSNPDSWIIRFNSQSSTAREVIPIEYYEHAFDLLNDTDSDYFTRRHGEIIVDGASVWEKRAQEDQSWANDFQLWSGDVNNSFGETSNDPSWSPRLAEPNYE